MRCRRARVDARRSCGPQGHAWPESVVLDALWQEGVEILAEKKRWIDPKTSVSDWFKPGEHFLSFAQIFERDAITELEKLIPHGEDIWIFVRGVDRFLRLPF
jgi:hypothetical protein